MTKKVNEIGTENMVRIKDEKVLSQLNEMYDQYKYDLYLSKNAFLNDVVRIGIEVLEKQENDNWAIKNEKHKQNTTNLSLVAVIIQNTKIMFLLTTQEICLIQTKSAIDLTIS